MKKRKSVLLSSFIPHPCFSDSFTVNAAQGCEERALFGLRSTGAGEALLVYRGVGVDFDCLQVADGLACERAVDGALQRVPGKLKSRAHIFIVNEDTPASIIHSDQVNARQLC